MTQVGVTGKPERVYLVCWKDIFNKERMAISLSDDNLSSVRAVDPDCRVFTAETTWVEVVKGEAA